MENASRVKTRIVRRDAQSSPRNELLFALGSLEANHPRLSCFIALCFFKDGFSFGLTERFRIEGRAARR